MLGMLSGTTDLGSLWAMVQVTGEVFSTEWVNTSSTPVGRMYNHDTGLCWQAPYSAVSGYGEWAESNTGPLGASCASVSSTEWYTKANTLSGGSTYTSAGTISSGYIGILHMVHESVNGIVFGGELDGRTLSIAMNDGKPVQGEIYVVSTSNSEETLVATTETSVQSQLYSSSAVDAGTVGGLTGSSAQTLRTQFGNFATIWSSSATVALAESSGLVSQRCPSTNTAAYIAVGCDHARDTGFNADFASRVVSTMQNNPRQAVSLQQFNTAVTGLQLLMVLLTSHHTHSVFAL